MAPNVLISVANLSYLATDVLDDYANAITNLSVSVLVSSDNNFFSTEGPTLSTKWHM
jgi:hypothetical protein